MILATGSIALSLTTSSGSPQSLDELLPVLKDPPQEPAELRPSPITMCARRGLGWRAPIRAV